MCCVLEYQSVPATVRVPLVYGTRIHDCGEACTCTERSETGLVLTGHDSETAVVSVRLRCGALVGGWLDVLMLNVIIYRYTRTSID